MPSAPDSRSDGFDAIRLIAAIAVLFSHSFLLTFGTNEGHEPFFILSRQQATIGTTAVLVFFVISGYLITQSFDRAPSASRFIRARVLRIFPGLVASLLVMALVLGPMVTTLPLAGYFTSPETSSFVAANTSLYLYWGHTQLPGVFLDNPWPDAVNASLWTLRYEFTCYLGVLALGVAGCLNRYVVAALWLVTAWLSWRWIGEYWVQFAHPFLGGSVLYLWRAHIRLDWRLAALSALLVLAAALTGGFRLAFASAGAYLVIYLATSPAIRLPPLAKYGDFSYGVYVYACPVQQLIAFLLGDALTWYADFCLALPIVLGCAWCSWHWVERPALALKSTVRDRTLAIGS